MTRSRTTLLTLAVLSWSEIAVAQSLDAPPSSAAALSLAGAQVTAASNGSALWLNPGLLVKARRGIQASLALMSVRRSVYRIRLTPLPEARDATGVQLAPAVSVALPLYRDQLWVGLGYHLGLHASSHYPLPVSSGSTDGTGRLAPARYRGTELELTQHVVSLGAAYRLGFLAVGAALELQHLELLHRQSLWAGFQLDYNSSAMEEDPKRDVDALVEAKDKLRLGGIVGLWLEPHPLLRLGCAVRLPVTTLLRGPVTLSPGSQPPVGYSSIAARSGEALVELALPLRIQAGASVGPPRLRGFVELALERWSSMGDVRARLQDTSLVLAGSAGTEERPMTELPLGLRLRDHLSMHVGLEAQLVPGFLIARTGYAFHRGATRPAAPSSTLVDLDRHVWSFGLEVERGALHLGLASAVSFEARLDAPGNEALLLNPLEPGVSAPVGQGRYTSSLVQVVLETGWRF